jgi:hypothetical protein
VDIVLLIFKLLGDRKVTSTCLGLTCKAFYRIHRAIWGSVGLWEMELWDSRGIMIEAIYLTEPLQKWAGPRLTLGYTWGTDPRVCFVSLQRAVQIDWQEWNMDHHRPIWLSWLLLPILVPVFAIDSLGDWATRRRRRRVRDRGHSCGGGLGNC